MPSKSAVKKPLVLVTGPDKRLRFGWWATRFALWLVGLRGVYGTASRCQPPPDVRGVIIGGGDDIEPKHYGYTGDAGAEYDRERDEFELAIAKQALACGVPVLGICRGAQLLNIVLGGSLHQDIRPLRTLTPNRNAITRIKQANIDADTKLHKIVKKESLRINSLHHQAIDRPGEGLIISSKDDDGFTQSVEKNDHAFTIGVQWHPEYLFYAREHRAIFAHFAKAINGCDARLDCRP